MSPKKCISALFFLLIASPAQADCLADVAAVKSVIANSRGYREIQSIRDRDGTIKTYVLDFKDKDKFRLATYDLSGAVGLGVFIGNRYWDRNLNGKWQENLTSSAAGIARGMITGKKIRIEPKNSEIHCSSETGDFGVKLEKFQWSQKEKSFSIDYQLWSDAASHIPVRGTWVYKGRPNIADSQANSIFLFSEDITIDQPN